MRQTWKRNRKNASFLFPGTSINFRFLFSVNDHTLSNYSQWLSYIDSVILCHAMQSVQKKIEWDFELVFDTLHFAISGSSVKTSRWLLPLLDFINSFKRKDMCKDIGRCSNVKPKMIGFFFITREYILWIKSY